MINLSPNSFITDTLAAVDDVIAYFVQTTYEQLVQGYSNTLLALSTLYILLLGYRFAMHTLTADFTTICRHLIVLLIVCSLCTNWSMYHLFIYNIFTNEPNHIAQIISQTPGQIPDETIAQGLNQVFSTGMEAATVLFSKGFYLFFCGLFVAAFTFLCCMSALGLLIYTKLAMAIGLALGPIFLTFILFESTRGWFVSWLGKLFNFSLVPIITTSILVLMLSIINLVLPDLAYEATVSKPNFFTVGVFGGLSLITAFLLKQSLSIASSLSGGFTLAALSQVGGMVKSALTSSGINTAAHLASRGFNYVRGALSERAAAQKQSTINAAVQQGKD